jgi:phosphosulfolactate synthase
MPAAERIFSFMRVPERTAKPRKTGITMVSGGDYWLAVAGARWIEDLVEWGAQWIDYYKVGEPMIYQPRHLVLKKLAVLKKHGIHPYAGGNTMEAAIYQRCVEPYFDELQELGINAMEVSSTVLSLSIAEKVKFIERARARGFTVFAEIGKKLIGAGGPEARMATDAVIAEMKECLSAGVFKVVYEHTEIEQLRKEEQGLSRLAEVSSAVGVENLLFEVPHGDWHYVAPYAAFYVLHFGSNVNIGDVEPAQVMAMETVRGGLSARTLGKVFVAE